MQMRLLPFPAIAAFIGAILVCSSARAQKAALSHEVFLPPEAAWSGASEQLVAEPGDPWITPSEESGLTATPDYDTTVRWLRRLVDAAPQLAMISIGTSAEGREIWMVISSVEGAASPESLRRNGRPTLLAHAGIHSGEIDGKDAGLMLLRDLTVGNRISTLLEDVNLLFIPILSVDGHERSSRTNRINQRGPSMTGWRTNARNLNLNRDFTKLETREIRALVDVFNKWEPDLYADLHVTDGVDYQYDVTYGFNAPYSWSPSISDWLAGVLRPSVDGALESMGHVPGPLIFARNDRDMSAGNLSWTAPPRFSTGYADLRHLPTVIVENHSLKPYRRRVLGTYVFLEATMRVLGRNFRALREAVAADRALQPDSLALNWSEPAGGARSEIVLKGIRSEEELSKVTGGPVVRWTGEKTEIVVPNYVMSRPDPAVKRPRAYYIPAAWAEITEKLRQHGVQVEVLSTARIVEVEFYRLPEAGLENPGIFEGRPRVTSGVPVVERRGIELRPGSAVVQTDQPLGDLAMVLLEPQAKDSFFSWGYLLEVLQQTEYAEPYVMEPMANRMLEDSEDLRRRFEQKLRTDKSFAGDAAARLNWFYEKTPYFDETYRLYPISRAITE